MSGVFEHPSPGLATAGSLLATLGMWEDVREAVHAAAGVVGDLGGMAITLVTLCYWVHVVRLRIVRRRGR